MESSIDDTYKIEFFCCLMKFYEVIQILKECFIKQMYVASFIPTLLKFNTINNNYIKK